MTNMSMMLAINGDFNDALAAAEEAAQLCDRLADRNAVIYEANRMLALNNLSLAAGCREQWPRALAAAEEAMAVHGRCVARRIPVPEQDFALVRRNLGVALRESGRPTEARVALR